MNPGNSISKLTGLGIGAVGVVAFSTLILASCGGSSGSGSGSGSLTLDGVVGIGEPIVSATVQISCMSNTFTGGLVNVKATTGSDGRYKTSNLDAQPPCRILATGGTTSNGPNKRNLKSVAIKSGTANVTPLTDLEWEILIRLNDGTPATPEKAVKAMTTTLSAYSNLSDPVATEFSATTPNPNDNALEAYAGIKNTTTEQLATAITSPNPASSPLVQSANAAIQTACANLGGCNSSMPLTPVNSSNPSTPITSVNPSGPSNPSSLTGT